MLESPLRPDSFPIGSPESRAAARNLLEARDKSGPERIQIVWDIWAGVNASKDSTPSVGPWYEQPDGRLARIIFAPGADEETIQRLLNTP